MISLPTDSTRIDTPSSAVHGGASEGKPAVKPAAKPATELRKAAVPAPAKPAADPRTASDRKPAAAPPAAPKAVPEVRKAPPPPAPAPKAEPVEVPEKDPEDLLREYTNQQKTKITRLEAQLVELKKVAAERDQYRAKSESLAKELEGAKRHLEAASKQDAVIKDLQAKVDASLLAHQMLSDENGKLKAKAQELATLARKLEEKSNAAEKGLADATKSLATQTEGRKDAEARISVALQVLQGEGPAKKPSATHPPEAKPAHAPEHKPAGHAPAPPRKA